jgi:hypothetical protein
VDGSASSRRKTTPEIVGLVAPLANRQTGATNHPGILKKEKPAEDTGQFRFWHETHVAVAPENVGFQAKT